MTDSNTFNRFEQSFGYWLKQYREDILKIPQEYLADALRIPVPTLAKYETGQLSPNLLIAQRMARHFMSDKESYVDFVAFAQGQLQVFDIGFRPEQGKLPPLELADARVDGMSNSVNVQFDLPETVKVPCQQYLLYFVEFLRDVGIDATAELREDARGVLFSVTPKDKQEALDNIREALAIYLHLPTNRQATSIITPETSIEVQRLQAQLLHFQGQVVLANAAIQQKELLIQQQQGFIQQQLLSVEVLVQSLQKESENEEESEPIVGDIIKVKQWEWEALEVDLPTLVRRLKERFGRR